MDLHLIAVATEHAVETAAAVEASGGALGTLGINWKLFIAQAINFSIVLFVLWKWVFKPVGTALEQRRQKIEESVRKADEIEKARLASDLQTQTQLKKAHTSAETILQKAIAEAQNIKQDTVSTARKESEKILQQAKASIQADKDQMFRELREEVATLTVMATEKILRSKLDDQKDKKLVEEAVRSIK